MHLLTCPSCHTSIPVSPSQAGDQANCPACQTAVEVPRLGDLKKLPMAPDAPSLKPAKAASGGFLFLTLGLIGTACLLVASYCGIRWALIDVPMTTEEHIAKFEAGYAEMSAAELIREYENMEEYGIELARPFFYKRDELKKSGWGNKAASAGAVGLLLIAGAFLFGRPKDQKSN
jgi:hypothetical protein